MNVAGLTSPAFAARIAGNRPAREQVSTAGQPTTSTVVTLSTEGRKASATSGAADRNLLGTPLLPTRSNAAMLAQEAGRAINARLEAAGIASSPPFELAIDDVNSAHVTVKGGRADAKAIEDLINSDPSLQMAVHNTYAIASHIPGVERAMAFSQEYSSAQSKAEIDRVLARYADALNGSVPAADIHLHIGTGGMTVTLNGEPLIA